MVDLPEIQTAYYLVAATGVLVAAIYYIFNMRAQTRTREAQLFMQIYKDFTSPNLITTYLDLDKMEWSNYDDFEKKYGSDNNPENYIKRMTWCNWVNGIGILLKMGLISRDIIYWNNGLTYLFGWRKWKSVIEENRRLYNGPDFMSGWEYLAGEMERMAAKRGISWNQLRESTRYLPIESN